MATKTDGAPDKPSYNRQRSNSDPQPAVDVLNALNTDKGIYIINSTVTFQFPHPSKEAYAQSSTVYKAVS